ncbi:MAG: AraC family transcriptional regulator [Spirochaetia bacterium]|jgi:AraC-like DNA-binding protein|nr:AraC family transcriptional regulator [Spirochaetia bacterium]
MPFQFINIDDTQRSLPFFLATIGYDWPQENIRRPTGYTWYQWLQCLSGKGELTVGGKRLEINPGDGFLLLPDEAHEYRNLSGDWITDWMGFGGAAVEGMLAFAGIPESGVYGISDLWRLKTLIRELYDASLGDSAVTYHDTSLLVYEFLLALRIALEPKTRDAQPRHAKLRPVLQFIRNNYHRPLSIDELSGVINVTPQYLCQIFKHSLNMRPIEYLSAFRVSRAKELLVARPSLPVAEIAGLVGFSDSNYLCRVFRKTEKMSPGAFRNLHCPSVEVDNIQI